jgi:transcriptional/translational regulatory protein YebC/TACO1
VRWLFEPKGIVTVELDDGDADEVSLAAIDAGAEDVQAIDTVLEVYTDPAQLEDVRSSLEGQGLRVVSSEQTMQPSTTVTLDGHAAEQALRLIERLEELDDVQAVYSNSDIPDEVAAALAG